MYATTYRISKDDKKRPGKYKGKITRQKNEVSRELSKSSLSDRPAVITHIGDNHQLQVITNLNNFYNHNYYNTIVKKEHHGPIHGAGEAGNGGGEGP